VSAVRGVVRAYKSQKLEEKMGNRVIDLADLKNEILLTHAQLQSGDIKLLLLVKGVDIKSYNQSEVHIQFILFMLININKFNLENIKNIYYYNENKS
jgi:hypothetical protein